MDLVTSRSNPCRNGSSMFLPLDSPPTTSAAGTHQQVSNSQNILWDSASAWIQSSHNSACKVADFDAQKLEWPIRPSAWEYDLSYHHAMQGAEDNKKMSGSAWESQAGLFGAGMDATQRWLFPVSSSSEKNDQASKDGMDSGRANTVMESEQHRDIGKEQVPLLPKGQQEGSQFRSDAAEVASKEGKVGEVQGTQQGYGGGAARREQALGDPSPISLKLGKRNYFEDASDGPASVGGGGARGPATPVPCNSGKKQRSQGSPGNVPRCQVEGCRTDLTTTKDYHRRHKVCEMHSKAAKVVAGGCEQRFCQQCSRFHVLAEFDDAKRSCRKRLASHNERRRKSSQDTSALAVCIAQDDRRPFSAMIDGSCFMQHPMLPFSSSVFDHGDTRRAACSPQLERFQEQAVLARRMQLLNGQRQSFLPCLPRDAAKRIFTLLQGSKAPIALNHLKDMNLQELHHLQTHGLSSLCQGMQTSAGASTLVGVLECAPPSLSSPGMPDSGRALSLLSSQSLSSSITQEYVSDPSGGTHYSLPTTEEKLLSLPSPPRSLPFTTMLPSAGELLDSLKHQSCLPSGLATIQDAATHPVLGRLFQGHECGVVGGQSSKNGRPTLDLMQLPSPSSQGTQFTTAQMQANGGKFSELQALRPYEAAMFDTQNYS